MLRKDETKMTMKTNNMETSTARRRQDVLQSSGREQRKHHTSQLNMSEGIIPRNAADFEAGGGGLGLSLGSGHREIRAKRNYDKKKRTG